MTRPGVELRSLGPLANTLLNRPMILLISENCLGTITTTIRRKWWHLRWGPIFFMFRWGLLLNVSFIISCKPLFEKVTALIKLLLMESRELYIQKKSKNTPLKKGVSRVWHKTASNEEYGVSPSLPLLPGPLWPGVIVSLRDVSIGKIDLLFVFNRTLSKKEGSETTTWNMYCERIMDAIPWPLGIKYP